MTIRAKLRVASLFLVGAVLAQLVVNTWASRTLEHRLNGMLNSSLVESSTGQELMSVLGEIQALILEASSGGQAFPEPEEVSANRDAFDRLATQFRSVLQRARVASLEGERLARETGDENSSRREDFELSGLRELEDQFILFASKVRAIPGVRDPTLPPPDPGGAKEVLRVLKRDLEPRLVNFVTGAVIEQREASAELTRLSATSRRLLIGTSTLTALVTLAGLIYSAGSFTRVLGRFSGAATEIANGNRALRLSYSRRDEFGELARALDGMLDSLQQSTISKNELDQIVLRRTRELQESRENLQVTLNSIADGVLATDGAGRVTHMNPVAEMLTGWSGHVAVGRPVAEVFRIVDETTRAPLQVPVGGVLENGSSEELANPVLLLSRDGREWPIAERCSPIRNAEGQAIGAVLVFRDVIKERAAERAARELNARLEQLVEERTGALQESERRLRTLFTNLPGMVYRRGCRQDMPFQFVSDGSKTLLGRSPEDLTAVASAFLDWVHAEDRSRVWIEIEKEVGAGRPFAVEYRMQHTEGDWHWVVDQGRGVFDSERRLVGIEGYVSDNSERKLTELALRRLSGELSECPREAFFGVAARSLADLLDAEIGFIGKVVSEDPPRLRMLGFSVDGAVQTPQELDPSSGPCANLTDRRPLIISTGVADAYPDYRPLKIWGADGYGAMPLMNASGRVVARIGILSRQRLRHPERVESMLQLFGARVVNELESIKANEDRHSFEQQLRQAQKMEAIGTLAGGIAHDFNNMLGSILGFTELLKHDVSTPASRENLHLIEVAASRARDLVRQILTFSRRTETERKPLQLGPLVADSVKLLRSTLPAMVQVHCHAEKVPDVLADATQVHQVVLNLCTNAWHALPEKDGVIDVQISSCLIGEADLRLSPDLQPGRYVRLRVKDNGCGMEPATLERIFDPFFTTKSASKGTGLGLAVVHGIMQVHRGAIVVRSEVGLGSTFDLHFPAVAGPAHPAPPKVMAPVVKRGSGERILLVDDEALIALSTERLLSREGYAVTRFSSPQEALDQFKQGSDAYDVLLTDLSMPEMTGVELASAAQSVRPNLPVLVMTGYLDPDIEEQLGTARIHRILKKPLMLGALTSAISDALGKNGNPPPA